MSTKRYANDFYLSKSIGNNSLYDSIEEQVRDTIEDYTHENVLAEDGTAASPSISFAADLNTGLYRASDDTLGISTNGIERIQVGTANTDISNGFRLGYQSGNPQLSFQLADTTYDLTMFTDSNEDMFINHGEFAKKIYLQAASSGATIVRSNSAAVTNACFEVQVGNGATYDEIFRADELLIRSSKPHRFSNGLVTTPSITFNNDTDTGLYLISSNSIGFAIGGSLGLSLNTSTDSLVLGVNNLLGQGTLEMSNQFGENIVFNDSNQSISLQCNDAAISTLNTVTITNTVPILAPDGSASNPSYSFSGATNFGMFHSGSDIVISDAGTEVWRWSGSQAISANPIRLPTYTTAGVPAGISRQIIYVSDGDAGSSCLAVYDGSSWKRISFGTTISAT